MTASGRILYITPPDALGYPASKNFALRGQIAIIRQPKASDDNSTTVVLLSGHRRARIVKTGYTFPDALVWSADASDLIVTSSLRAEAISASGARTALPSGWFP
jgi:hypothetical protein